jgi:hypothetical protein|uniref:DUF1844 domain-containing protein n=1 Tax=Desulfobacca acetoxidans TaxID=60893 RepID=A0A7V6A4E5_9BACT
MAETEDKGYTVHDRRFLHKSEEEKAEILKEEAARRKAAASQDKSQEKPKVTPLPEITFSAFLISLSSSAFVHLGDIPDPATGQIKKDLALAKQTIDLLGLLREKTRNNLEEDEEKLFDHLLYDLRLRYVKEAG